MKAFVTNTAESAREYPLSFVCHDMAHVVTLGEELPRAMRTLILRFGVEFQLWKKHALAERIFG